MNKTTTESYPSIKSPTSYYCCICDTETEQATANMWEYGMGVCVKGHSLHFHDIRYTRIQNQPKIAVYSVYKYITPDEFTELSDNDFRDEMYFISLEAPTTIYHAFITLRKLAKEYISKKIETTSFYQYVVNNEPLHKTFIKSIIPVQFCPVCQGDRIVKSLLWDFALQKLGFNHIHDLEVYLLDTFGTTENILKHVIETRKKMRELNKKNES